MTKGATLGSIAVLALAVQPRHGRRPAAYRQQQ
jgi:hypothetical protein